MAFQRRGKFVNTKWALPCKISQSGYAHKPLTHTRLLINHVIGMIWRYRRMKNEEDGVVAIERL